MKFTTSVSAGLILATTILALPFENFPQYCKENLDTTLHCLYEGHSGVMFRCSGGRVLDYSCPDDQVCVMFTVGSSTTASCAERSPAPANADL
ncbi:hypothetical protein K493DRAFT_319038 [Basidiobolus meristosporus CBS 931.73]|uniref:Carbohydrate-binding module family 19 domain-containing protein n=1 Tax=Basidiobolus meristosporus CBS 931.73 TaxID=1314790 RepID=A0A1Y1XTD7_9FUNG|nr:hypothetical protein K493DRAFT_319038 [Basidiobolus meristosporus CBS 931.73]|eukprot:ORX89000.1 hypothetical protein K493DRAFT_319038 [Basidiobolus meristosporus CBS 931.73]